MDLIVVVLHGIIEAHLSWFQQWPVTFQQDAPETLAPIEVRDVGNQTASHNAGFGFMIAVEALGYGG